MFVRISPAELSQALRLEQAADGYPAWSDIMALLRQALSRWGVSQLSTLTRYIRRTFRACGIADDAGSDRRIRQAAELICTLGDAEGVRADVPPEAPLEEADDLSPSGALRGRLLAPALPRYVSLGSHVLAIGSVELLDAPLHQFGDTIQPCSAARWLKKEDSTLTLLDALGFEACELEDWLGPSAVLEQLERRRSSQEHVSALWPQLVRSFESASAPVSDPSGVAVLVGSPGGWFGLSKERSGRWCDGASAPEGLWLGTVDGYGVRPVVVETRAGIAARLMELFDFDEWRWALLSRGICSGQPESAGLDQMSLKFSCPLPQQALRLQALCQVESWRWTLPSWVDSSLIAELFTQRFGLRFQ